MLFRNRGRSRGQVQARIRNPLHEEQPRRIGLRYKVELEGKIQVMILSRVRLAVTPFLIVVTPIYIVRTLIHSNCCVVGSRKSDEHNFCYIDDSDSDRGYLNNAST